MNAVADSPEVRLDAIRVAWRTYCAAEATITRLSAYQFPSRLMRSDLHQARMRKELARADLTRLLREPTLPPENEAESLTGVASQPRSGGSLNPPCSLSGDPS